MCVKHYPISTQSNTRQDFPFLLNSKCLNVKIVVCLHLQYNTLQLGYIAMPNISRVGRGTHILPTLNFCVIRHSLIQFFFSVCFSSLCITFTLVYCDKTNLSGPTSKAISHVTFHNIVYWISFDLKWFQLSITFFSKIELAEQNKYLFHWNILQLIMINIKHSYVREKIVIKIIINCALESCVFIYTLNEYLN